MIPVLPDDRVWATCPQLIQVRVKLNHHTNTPLLSGMCNCIYQEASRLLISAKHLCTVVLLSVSCTPFADMLLLHEIPGVFSRLHNLLTEYTVNHKKREILLLTITLANLNRFLQFLCHFNREEILHATIIKPITSLDLCAHLTWKNQNLHFCHGS